MAHDTSQMFTEEMEQHLKNADRLGIGDSLRRLRDKLKDSPEGIITPDERASHYDQPDAERQKRDAKPTQENLMFLLGEKEIPLAIRDMCQSKRDERNNPLQRLVIWSRLAASIGDDQARLVALCGGPGTGKTLTACLWLSRQARGLFVPAERVARLSRAVEDSREFNRLAVTTCLVIDDIGRGESPNKWNGGRIEELMCERYDSGMITVCTTNFSPRDFCALYGARTQSRFKAIGGLIVCKEVMRK